MASKETMEEVLKVLRRHIDDETLTRIFGDLVKVRGGKSFADTVMALHDMLESMR